MVLQTICIKPGDKVQVLDQTLLPLTQEYIPIDNSQNAWDAIHTMKVRGAPAIAIVALFGLAKEMCSKQFTTDREYIDKIRSTVNYLKGARPTAVNIFTMLDNYEKEVRRKLNLFAGDTNRFEQCTRFLWQWAKLELEKDLSQNIKLSELGCQHIRAFRTAPGDKFNILTHCNTGSLATGGYGTALGVIRAMHEKGIVGMVYCTETRPYNQGARLTAFELLHDQIPATLICDSMVADAMKIKQIHLVIVGADRVTRNGDTANKIGTYQIAILADRFKIPFYVACASSTMDPKLPNGDGIVIEERSANEVRMIGNTQIAPKNIQVWNPSFDVTPCDLIEAFITEEGVFRVSELQNLKIISNTSK